MSGENIVGGLAALGLLYFAVAGYLTAPAEITTGPAMLTTLAVFTLLVVGYSVVEGYLTRRRLRRMMIGAGYL